MSTTAPTTHNGTEPTAITIETSTAAKVQPIRSHASSTLAHDTHFHFPHVSMHSLRQKFEQSFRKRATFDQDVGIFNPSTDIRETKYAFHIEISLPGLSSTDQLIIQWMSARTLVVQGDLQRPLVGLGKEAQGERLWESTNSEGWPTEARAIPENVEEGGDLKVQPSIDETDTPTFLLIERKTGLFQRTFTLPENIVMGDLRASLYDGLLRIDVPKRKPDHVDGQAVRINLGINRGSW